MDYLRKLLSSLAILTIALFITRCGQEEPLVLPELPTVAADVQSLAVTRGEVQSFNVTITAPGKFREVNATVGKGTVAITNIVGVGTEAATATIVYTAPSEAGESTILIKVIDNSSQDVGTTVAVTTTQAAPMDVLGGDVEGEWGPYITMNVKGNVTIPAGKSLTIREGTTVIMNGESLTFTADGDFYSMGSEKYPNKFTVATEPTTDAEIYNHVWSGIMGTENVAEMVALYTTFQYTEGAGIDFNSATGKFIMQHSAVKFTKGHGVHINQGELLVSNNTFFYNGDADDDGLHIENGAKGDVAYNTFINSTGDGVGVYGAIVNIYNNTAVRCGGSFTLADGGSGVVYDNIIYNCGHGVLFPLDANAPDLEKTKWGYNLYFADTDDGVNNFYPANGSARKTDPLSSHDLAGAKGENNPLFHNWPGTDSKLTPDYDLRLDVNSPAFTKGTTNFAKIYDKHTVDGVDYATPAASTTLGATAKYVAPTTP